MQFTITHPYPRDTETVFKVLSDRQYLLKKFAYTGSRNITILECEQKNGFFVIKSQQEVPSNPPGFAKKFVKPWNLVIGTDTWQNYEGETKTGTFNVDVKGIPIRFTGKLELKPTKTGCNYAISFDVTVKIPLIGGKLEKLAEEDTRSNQALDFEFTRKYLENL